MGWQETRLTGKVRHRHARFTGKLILQVQRVEQFIAIMDKFGSYPPWHNDERLTWRDCTVQDLTDTR